LFLNYILQVQRNIKNDIFYFFAELIQMSNAKFLIFQLKLKFPNSSIMLSQVILSKLKPGADDLHFKIDEYLYWDVYTLKFAKHRASIMKNILRPLKFAASRATGFGGQEPNDSLDEHWVHNAEGGASLQAINCGLCGNYVYSNTLAKEHWTDDDNIDTYREKCLTSGFKNIICLCDHQDV
jgi:hypothetical protein